MHEREEKVPWKKKEMGHHKQGQTTGGSGISRLRLVTWQYGTRTGLFRRFWEIVTVGPACQENVYKADKTVPVPQFILMNMQQSRNLLHAPFFSLSSFHDWHSLQIHRQKAVLWVRVEERFTRLWYAAEGCATFYIFLHEVIHGTIRPQAVLHASRYVAGGEGVDCNSVNYH